MCVSSCGLTFLQDTGEEITPGYQAPAKKDLKTIQDLDQDDESLVKYKQQLLGKATEALGEREIRVATTHTE